MDNKENENAEEKLYSKNYTKFGLDMNIFVSLVSAILVLGFIIFTIVKPNVSEKLFSGINSLFNRKFNWLYVITINAAFMFLIYIGFSKLGRIRLGGYTSTPEYGDLAWYSMMFSAGIGIGIFFYGVAEPIYHLNIPTALRTGSEFDNFKVMYLHWGAHAWAVYGLLAIGLGYFSYNKGLPFAIRSLFYPILKDKIYGVLGDIIDTVATLSVLFGLATSLGLGVQQINSGLNYIFGIPDATNVQVLLIIGITFIATLSVVAVIAIMIFFVTSSDSGSLVVSSLTSGGRTSPPKFQRVFWALTEGAIALSVLLIGGEGALKTIESAVVILGLPFTIILIMIMVSMVTELKESYKKYNYNRTITLKRRLSQIDRDTKFK